MIVYGFMRTTQTDARLAVGYAFLVLVYVGLARRGRMASCVASRRARPTKVASR